MNILYTQSIRRVLRSSFLQRTACTPRVKGWTCERGESQKHIDSDGVSESENKRHEKTLKVMCFMDSKKNHAQRIFLIAHAMLPVIGALLEGEGPEDGCSRAVRDFSDMSCVLEKLWPTPKILYVYRRGTDVTSLLGLRVWVWHVKIRQVQTFL